MSDKPDDRHAKTVLGSGRSQAPAGKTLIGVGQAVEPAAPEQPAQGPGPQAETVVTRGGTKPAQVVDAGDDEALVGMELSGYCIERKLAEGGMGVVYVAEHTKIGKRAAIKVLKLEYCRDESIVARFSQEARAVNEIRHENIVEIYDFGRDPNGRVYYVMELLDGMSLDELVKQRQMSFAEVGDAMNQICRALGAAHAKGFVHRDLKPENIWLRPTQDGRSEIKLLDFGIAKLIGSENAEDKLTRTGTMIGTPHYMSPEQINGSATIDQRSDIYSLGVILYEIVSGARPFQGPTLQAIIAGHVLHDPPPIANHGDHPKAIESIISRMLAKNPDDRYQDVGSVASDIGDIAADRRPSNLTTLQRERPVRPMAAKSGRRRWPLALAGVIAIAAGGALAWKLTAGAEDPASSTSAATNEPTKPPTTPEAPPPAEPPLDYEALRVEARGLIRSSLEDTEPKVRVVAVDATAETLDPASNPKLAELAEKDPDLEVRGHAAVALGDLGSSASQKQLEALLKKADPGLAPWYAEAATKLGSRRGKRALQKLARERELATAFKATLALADHSEQGDAKAISALRKLAAREAELVDIAPYAGIAILSRLARLGVGAGRDALRAALGSEDTGARLAAAEGLARLGDDSAAETLKGVLADGEPPNRVVAAASLIELGDYSGFDVLSENLEAKKPGLRALAARALGAIGEKSSLRPLIALYLGTEKPVRISAASAVLRIVGLEPAVLAQGSIDWAKSALASDNWAVREAAASTLGELPEARAVTLLAQAVADPDKKVRRAAATSASKMRGKKAASVLAAAVTEERDKGVKELQVRALASIGQPESKAVLTEIASKGDRVGVIAIGSLIAVGETSAVSRLETAVADKSKTVRLAAVDAAVVANNPVAVPTLEKGIDDRVFDVRFSASVGLAFYRRAKDRSMTVLLEGLDKRSEEIRARARAAMLRFGVTPKGFEPRAVLDTGKPAERLASVGAIAELPWQKAGPLLRRAARDGDTGVKRAAVEAVRRFETSDKEETIRFYKLLIGDRDRVTKERSRGRLADLTEPPKKTGAVTTPPPTAPAADLAPSIAAVKKARATFDSAASAVARLTATVAKKTSQPATDEAEIDAVERLEKKLDSAEKALASAGSALKRAASAADAEVAKASGPEATDAAAEIASARKVKSASESSARKIKSARAAIKSYVQKETADPGVYVAAADAAIATGKLSSAKRDLRKAESLYKKQGKVDAQLYFSYGRLYERLAAAAKNDKAKLENLRKAKRNYDRFAASGKGKRLSKAQARSAELDAEIKALTP